MRLNSSVKYYPRNTQIIQTDIHICIHPYIHKVSKLYKQTYTYSFIHTYRQTSIISLPYLQTDKPTNWKQYPSILVWRIYQLLISNDTFVTPNPWWVRTWKLLKVWLELYPSINTALEHIYREQVGSHWHSHREHGSTQTTKSWNSPDSSDWLRITSRWIF